jgi:DNA-binding response OmpR family regulator
MVVDDDPCIINLLVAVVRSHFNIQEVLGITDSSKASETFNEFKPTVIVIDQSMPNVSGVELIKAIREFDSDVGILFTTGYPLVEAVFAASKLGADKFLTKPFKIDDLLRTLETCHFLHVKRRRRRSGLRSFLCHCSKDKPTVRNLYHRLTACGLDVWLDEESLLPGQDWKYEIEGAIRQSNVIIVCCSANSVAKQGFVHAEIQHALDVACHQPEGNIFVIPVRLDESQVPDRLRHLQWVDYFEQRGFDKLMHALEARADQISGG